jgi:hypothetical protein
VRGWSGFGSHLDFTIVYDGFLHVDWPIKLALFASRGYAPPTQILSVMINLTLKKFTGKSFSVNVHPESTVSDLKEAIAEVKQPGSAGGDQLWQIETHLTFNGNELRDHQPISRYGITDGSVLHIGEYVEVDSVEYCCNDGEIVPPPRERKITLNFEKDSDPDRRFTLSVKPNITVNQLKREIAIEEGIEVTQLKYVAVSDDSVHDDDDDDDGDSIAALTFRELADEAQVSQYQNETIIVLSTSSARTQSPDIDGTFSQAVHYLREYGTYGDQSPCGAVKANRPFKVSCPR